MKIKNRKKTQPDISKKSNWQKKSNKILKRDNYTCQICGKSNAGMIHYKNFLGLERWEYLADELTTFCYRCWLEETGIATFRSGDKL